MPLPRLLSTLLCLLTALPALAAPGYRILHTYPHDPQAFTQGLIYLDGHLYESTGLNGQSTLREEDLTTGKTLQRRDIPTQFFAEGLTNWGDSLIQLTWKAHTAFLYNRATFAPTGVQHYTGEGWGLTQNGRQLILSDGSSTLRFLNPSTFAVERTLPVTDHGKPIDQLNELEYIHGQVFANVWLSNRIARISPVTGKVLGWLDLSALLPDIEHANSNAVLNGIAFDAAHNRLFVTGKLWPSLFEIQLTRDR